jgi:3,4-dihydroxy 2-butanone 4-phosphate synthase/GTP cyclohydrolase II
MTPRVTLAYAQSLDGCIALRRGERTALSGHAASVYTHQLRARHDAILVGVGTVIADNPRLTVRLVAGNHPQPIVFDGQLRIPHDCALLMTPARPLWVLCNESAPLEKQHALEALGARVIRIGTPATRDEQWQMALDALAQNNINTLMVEGGAQIITSLLQSRRAHYLSVTIAPRLLGGLPAVAAHAAPLPDLTNMRYQQLGDDIIMEADLL